MNVRLVAAILATTALSGCFGAGMTPNELLEQMEAQKPKLEAAWNQTTTIPEGTKATYSGSAVMGYGRVPAEGEVIPVPENVLLGQMAMEADFAADGGSLKGSLSGFHATDGSRLTREQFLAIKHNRLDRLSPVERAGIGLVFDTPVSGDISFSGPLVEGDPDPGHHLPPPGKFYWVDMDGELDNDGQIVTVGGKSRIMIVGENAGAATLTGSPMYGAEEYALQVTADGEAQAATINGFTIKDE